MAANGLPEPSAAGQADAMTDTRDRLAALWPTDALSLRTPRLELRPIVESEFPELIEAITAGIHDPAAMPFGVPWTDAPVDELVANSLRHFWSARAMVAHDGWTLQLGVRHDGRLIGIQEMKAERFGVTHVVSTGSWLTRDVQGRGIGAEMRMAVLLFAFDHLGAEQAESGAFVDNPASNAVSRRLGYTENGRHVRQRRPGERADHQDYLVTPTTLRRPDWTLDVSGLEACRHRLVGAP